MWAVEVRNDSLLASLRALVSRVDLVLQEVVLMQSGDHGGECVLCFAFSVTPSLLSCHWTGEMPVNYELLRKAAKLCNLLPTLAGASDQAQKKLGCGITEVECVCTLLLVTPPAHVVCRVCSAGGDG